MAMKEGFREAVRRRDASSSQVVALPGERGPHYSNVCQPSHDRAAVSLTLMDRLV